MQQRSVIITAGGTGKRMNSVQPKQFLLLKGKPILMHTLEKLYDALPESQFIVTLPEGHKATWTALCEHHHCTIPHLVLSGGEERYHSVKRALDYCTGDVIAVHDGVRPFVSPQTIARLFDAVEQHDAVIPVIALKESLRKTADGNSISVPRADYRIVQTPQVFRAETLKKAYEQEYTAFVTDDAGLVEQTGITIQLVEGNEENIKITTPQDLVMASWFLNQDQSLK